MVTPIKTVQTCLREVDVSDFIPIVEHPIFLILGDRTQLSCVDKVYFGARHSREEHSYFVFHFCDELTIELLKKGFLTYQQATNLKIGALLHDLGHGPFSHVLEFMLGSLINREKPKTHNDRTKELLDSEEKNIHGRTIREAISLCHGDLDRVIDIVTKSAPESSIISHNTLGVDKLGYILLDSHHTGYQPQIPFILDLFPWYIYKDGELGIAEKKVPQIKNIQNVIQDMYIHVYYHDTVKQFARILQKAVELEVKSSELTPEEVWDMNEGALTYRLTNSENPEVKELQRRYLRNELYEPAVSFKIKDYVAGSPTPNNGKVVGIERDFSNHLIDKYTDPLNLTRLEERLCDSFGLSITDVLVTLSADPKRIVPEDTVIYTAKGEKKGTLFDMYPEHYSSLIEKSEDFFALRVYTTSDLKDRLMSKTESVTEFL